MGHAWKLVETIYPATVSSSVLLITSWFMQVAASQNADVTFTAASIAIVTGILVPIVGALTLLFTRLLAAKDETIKLLQVTNSALNGRINEGMEREIILQGKLTDALAGGLRENRDVMREVVAGLDNLENQQERRHNQFVQIMTRGDRRVTNEQRPPEEERRRQWSG